jgi:hypothetical protein
LPADSKEKASVRLLLGDVNKADPAAECDLMEGVRERNLHKPTDYIGARRNGIRKSEGGRY